MPKFSITKRGPLHWLLSWLLLKWEQTKGASTVYELFAPARLTAKLVATSLMGYELSVFCRKKHYTRIYERFFVPAGHHVIYQITATASNDAPQALKDACELELSISSSTHWTVDEDFQERLAVQAYLDLVIAHLQRQAA